MLAPLDKQRIGEHFAKALTSYEQHALAQKRINRHLCQMLTDSGQGQFRAVLEIGCGTGDLTRLLAHHYQIQAWCLNDLNAEAIAHTARTLSCDTVKCIAADAEQIDQRLPLAQQFDLWVSASTVQWFHQPRRFVELARQGIKPNGWLLFSTFLPSNLSEIKQLTDVGLNYPSSEEWQQWLQPHFELIRQEQPSIVLWFDTPREVLRHLQATGVTATNRSVWTKGRLQAFYEQYTQQFGRADGKVSLSYAPLLMLVRRGSCNYLNAFNKV
ncbi:MAG: malonyl-ACP O-methyltransferase BioC [Moraxella sp.]|nr:malonyl-ACP O-methyltransferase BioC [Moraxella sp.]